MYKILKKYYIAMMIFLIPNILIVFSCVYRVDYSITSPGGVSSVDNRFEVSGGYDSDNLLSLYVYSFDNITLFQKIISNFYDIYDVKEVTEGFSHMSDYMWYKAGVIQREQSEEASAIIAYEAANKLNSNISIDYDYLGAIIRLTTEDNNVFQLGDIVTHVDDVEFENFDHYVSLERKIGTKLTYIRNDVVCEHVIKEGDNWGAWYYDKYAIISSSPSYKISSTLSVGPSAGMMQTLSIYNQLVETNITYKDGVSRLIAGTGTIEVDGSIGAIGGVAQKVYSAFNSGADILIVSKSNEEAALDAYNSLQNKERMQLIVVSTFDEVLECLS